MSTTALAIPGGYDIKKGEWYTSETPPDTLEEQAETYAVARENYWKTFDITYELSSMRARLNRINKILNPEPGEGQSEEPNKPSITSNYDGLLKSLNDLFMEKPKPESTETDPLKQGVIREHLVRMQRRHEREQGLIIPVLKKGLAKALNRIFFYTVGGQALLMAQVLDQRATKKRDRQQERQRKAGIQEAEAIQQEKDIQALATEAEKLGYNKEAVLALLDNNDKAFSDFYDREDEFITYFKKYQDEIPAKFQKPHDCALVDWAECWGLPNQATDVSLKNQLSSIGLLRGYEERWDKLLPHLNSEAKNALATELARLHLNQSVLDARQDIELIDVYEKWYKENKSAIQAGEAELESEPSSEDSSAEPTIEIPESILTVDELEAEPEPLSPEKMKELVIDYLSYDNLDMTDYPEKAALELQAACQEVMERKQAGNLEENEKKYAISLNKLLERAGKDQIETLVQTLHDRFMEQCKGFYISPQPISKSKAWIFWDLAKQNYLRDHPDESTPEYRLADPLNDGQIQQEIVDRHFGWEIYAHGQFRDSKLFNEPEYDFLTQGPNGDEFFQLIDKEPKEDNSDLSSRDLARLGEIVRLALVRRDRGKTKR